MRTRWDKPFRTVRRAGNVVDLEEFRRKMEPAQRDSLARKPASAPWTGEETPAFRPVVLTPSPEERRRARQQRRAWVLDVWASLAVILMTVVFALRILI